jgi:pilin/secretion family protein with methylation motif
VERSSSKGFSLVETVVALGVLTTGILGAAAVFATGMQNLGSSPDDVITTQKAAQAIEAVFSARDTGTLTWAQINNVSHGGVFLDGPQPLKLPGPDGLVNTSDDTTIETVVFPGQDQIIGTSDDQIVVLASFTREIKIQDVPNENSEVRSVVVTIKYQSGSTKRTYTLTTYISAFA